MEFKKSERKKARLRLALTGASGSGKTWSALEIATGIGGSIAVIDTEHESASLYSDRFEFSSLSMQPPYSPERFIQAIEAAEKAGFTTVIIDSYSHEWDGSGGCLEINDTAAQQKFRGNTWAACNETTPRHRKLTDKILASPLHIICTMRSKTETVQGADKKVIKLGMKPIQRDGAEYEFTTVLDIHHESHVAIASKDRTGLFTEPLLLSVSTGVMLKNWLESGVDPRKMAIGLLEPLLDAMRETRDLTGLQDAYHAAKTAANGYPDLLDQVVLIKDQRKADLAKEQV